MPELLVAPVLRASVRRCVRLSLRNVDGLFTALALPVILMLMFVYLFGGAIATGGHYVDYVVPGVLLVCVSFGAASTAVSVASDLATGVVDRFRSLDVGGETLINAHVVASVARNLVATVITVAVAVAVGFRAPVDVLRWVAALVILVAFVLALSWVAALLGVLAGSVEAATGLSFAISFLAYPSSAFVPVDTMPRWLRAVAAHQPVTPVADSLRDLLAGRALGATGWIALGWCGGIVVVAVFITGLVFRRKID